jgi:hypothetical protein
MVLTGESTMTAAQQEFNFDIDPDLDEVVLEWIDEVQGTALLDQRAREWLGITGKEFARAFCAGELDIEAPHVGMLYFLLGFAGIECNARSYTRRGI